MQSQEFVGFTREVDASMMLAGYRHGIFVMGYAPNLYQWWAPDPRGVLPLDKLRVSRSLRRSVAAHQITFDTAFGEVVAACADPDRPGGWIDGRLEAAYHDLHAQGYAHSVETRTADGDLVGGLFVVCVGGLVCGESMFHTVRDASKVALVGLVGLLQKAPGPVLLETQWMTDHLASLGVVPMARKQYVRRIRTLVTQPNVL